MWNVLQKHLGSSVVLFKSTPVLSPTDFWLNKPKHYSISRHKQLWTAWCYSPAEGDVTTIKILESLSQTRNGPRKKALTEVSVFTRRNEKASQGLLSRCITHRSSPCCRETRGQTVWLFPPCCSWTIQSMTAACEVISQPLIPDPPFMPLCTTHDVIYRWCSTVMWIFQKFDFVFSF